MSPTVTEIIEKFAMPVLSQGLAGASLLFLWLTNRKQDRNNLLLRRLIAIHCEKYPDDAFRLLNDETEAPKS